MNFVNDSWTCGRGCCSEHRQVSDHGSWKQRCVNRRTWRHGTVPSNDTRVSASSSFSCCLWPGLGQLLSDAFYFFCERKHSHHLQPSGSSVLSTPWPSGGAVAVSRFTAVSPWSLQGGSYPGFPAVLHSYVCCLIPGVPTRVWSSSCCALDMGRRGSCLWILAGLSLSLGNQNCTAF